MPEYKTFIDPVEAQSCSPEFWEQHNLRTVAAYRRAKKRGKTKKSDALIADYESAGGLITRNGFYMAVSVSDLPGRPVTVTEYPAVRIGAQPRKLYDLGGGWIAHIEPSGPEITVWKNDAILGSVLDLEPVLKFCRCHNVNVTRSLLLSQVAALSQGFKVQQRINSLWIVFSPIYHGNGLIFRFIADKSAPEYIC